LTNHIVNSYDKELERITKLVVEMGLLVRDLLHIAEQSLRDPEADLLPLARATDKKVNALDTEIERQATAILALRQPMAIDLRMAISALRIAVIMERMGDLAKNTVKRRAKMTMPLSENITRQVSAMITIIASMMEHALTAFQEKNTQQAYEVVLRDGEVDIIYHQLMDELQQDLLNFPQAALSILQVIFAVRNIERIGDYTSKTANMVHYILAGEKVVKPKLKPTPPESS